MSRMADLDAAIVELRKCGEAIISVSDALRTSFSTETEQPALPPLPTIDQVRALLAEKSGEGKTKEVKALLNKYDAGKLSGVKPEDYPAPVSYTHLRERSFFRRCKPLMRYGTEAPIHIGGLYAVEPL